MEESENLAEECSFSSRHQLHHLANRRHILQRKSIISQHEQRYFTLYSIILVLVYKMNKPYVESTFTCRTVYPPFLNLGNVNL